MAKYFFRLCVTLLAVTIAAAEGPRELKPGWNPSTRSRSLRIGDIDVEGEVTLAQVNEASCPELIEVSYGRVRCTRVGCDRPAVTLRSGSTVTADGCQATSWPRERELSHRHFVLGSSAGEIKEFYPPFPFPPGESRGGDGSPHGANCAPPPARGISKRSAEIPLARSPCWARGWIQALEHLPERPPARYNIIWSWVWSRWPVLK